MISFVYLFFEFIYLYIYLLICLYPYIFENVYIYIYQFTPLLRHPFGLLCPQLEAACCTLAEVPWLRAHHHPSVPLPSLCRLSSRMIFSILSIRNNRFFHVWKSMCQDRAGILARRGSSALSTTSVKDEATVVTKSLLEGGTL